ncbi:MAG: hypothetical protein QOF70_6444 [Acetobacteraceae bacterium]|jgi:two-component sensor histidine kinase|nr:hypothetical protein [Acetobacteraceae bacterium]
MLKVMIAEDDLFMADMLEDVLIGGGYDVCGIARTVSEAIELGERHKPDLAVLDVRLADGDLGTDIGARLNRVGGPGILYATGNLGQIDLGHANGTACLVKPYRPADLIRALKIVEQILSTGHGSQPFPKGFYVLEQPSIDAQSKSSAGGSASMSASREPAEIRQLRRHQAALAGFGSFALGEGDLGKVLTEAARVCAASFEVPFCTVWRYRSEQNDLFVEAGVGWRQGVIGHVVSRADAGSPQGRAFVSRESVIRGDLREDARSVRPAFHADHGIISTVDVIIGKQGVPYGVLEIGNLVQHDYDHHDIDFLTGFANVLAEAVSASERRIAMQSSVDRMEGMIADRDRLLAETNVVLGEKSALLIEKNRLLDERTNLAQELQHEVRNNLQLVYGMLIMQLENAAGALGRQGIGAIARRVMTLAQVFDHLLGAGLNRTADFGGYLSSLCSSLENLQSDQNSTVALTCHSKLVILDLDTVTTLGLAISELISNSYDHVFPGGTGTITVTLSGGEPGSDGTIIFVDDGVGFTEVGDSKRHGLGLVKRLMQQINGSAVFRSDHGAEWTLRFPVPAAPRG